MIRMILEIKRRGRHLMEKRKRKMRKGLKKTVRIIVKLAKIS